MSTRVAEQVTRHVRWHKSTPDDPLIKYKLLKYGEADFLNGQLIVSAACASFVLKGEDKHVLVYDEAGLEDCQRENDPNVPLLLAFAGVFDGHGGHLASSYCATGMLPHVLSETAACIQKHASKTPHDPTTAKDNTAHKARDLQSSSRQLRLSSLRYHSSESLRALDGSCHYDSPLECGFVNAFHRAHRRFGDGSDPPMLEDVIKGKQYTRTQQQQRHKGLVGKFLRRAVHHPNTRHPKGGTTACTLAIYAERSKLGDAYRPMPYALVANCGDSRLITDDGTGGSSYRQVSIDHRPVEPSERLRLKDAKQITDISVREDPGEEPHPIPRLFPGGLAVSRTIGDCNLTKAAIPTPDMFRVPLHVSKEETAAKHETHQRFIMGTDGLFDVLTNEEIGKLAARVQETDDNGAVESDDPVILSTRDATVNIMDHCLRYARNFDDINLLVVDVVCYGEDALHHGRHR